MNKILEDHPDWYYPIPNMKTLILGTYPPHRSKWHFEFYYPNKNNRFWKVLSKIGSVKIHSFNGSEATRERKKLMKKLRVGVQNLGKTIIREDLSASDNKIMIIDFQNIKAIVEDALPTLNCILLTGYSGRTSTYKDFIRYLDQHHIEHTLPPQVKAGESFKLTLRKRTIPVLIANSTSSAAASIGESLLVDQFKKALFYKSDNSP